jgi:site-specific DNA-cytosine methylase
VFHLDVTISAQELVDLLYNDPFDNEPEEPLKPKPRYKQNIHGVFDLYRLWGLPYNTHRPVRLSRYSLINYCQQNGTSYHISDTVELEPIDGKEQGDFIKIGRIKRYVDSDVGDVICGTLFRVSKEFPTGIEDSREVTMLAHIRYGQMRNILRSSEVEIPAKCIIRKRDLEMSTEQRVSCDSTLRCHTVMICYYQGNPFSKKKKPVEWEFRLLLPSEVSLSQRYFSKDKKAFSQGFAYISIFSGAGGDTQGAKLAGAKTLLCVDHDREACNTLRQNHPDVTVFKGDQFDVTQGAISQVLKYDFIPDMLHLSTVCKTWSPNHVHEGRNDEENSALLFCTRAHLAHFRPLVCTIEQTAGLFERHQQCFFRLISDIFESGYSVRWTICDFRRWGLIGRRRRLIIFSARQGIPLPPFPPPTHGELGSGLTPYTSLSTLSQIPASATLHMPLSSLEEKQKCYDPDKRVMPCITTAGTTILHWMGRHFTIRELAVSQGFPVDYHFSGTKKDILRQIGNAIPPIVWEKFVRVIMKTIKEWKCGMIDAEGRKIESRNESHLATGRPTSLPEPGTHRSRKRRFSDSSKKGEKGERRPVIDLTVEDE